MRRLLFLPLIVFLLCSHLSAATYEIGPDNTCGTGNAPCDYQNMTALITAHNDNDISVEAGDTIKVYPGIYSDEPWTIPFGGTSENRIIIKGVDASGADITTPQETVIWDASTYDGGGYNSSPYHALRSADFITLQGVCVKASYPTYEPHMTVEWHGEDPVFQFLLFKDCNRTPLNATHDCVTATVQYCEFDGGQDPAGKLTSHMVYSYCESITYQYNLFHNYDSINYNILKCRDKNLIFRYNRVHMYRSQNGIHLGVVQDWPGPYTAKIYGNLFINDAGSTKLHAFIALRNDNAPYHSVRDTTIITNNTFVDFSGVLNTTDNNWRGVFEIVQKSGDISDVSNNAIYSNNLDGKTLRVNSQKPANQGLRAENACDFNGTNNWIVTGATLERTSISNTIFGENPKLTDAYHPAAGSDLINAGNNEVSIIPLHEYSADAARQDRHADNLIDIGAFEYSNEIVSPSAPENLIIKSSQ